jgi:hypothetical protein
MKRFYIFTIVFLFAGNLFSVNAQDVITLRTGKSIEAKIVRITTYEQHEQLLYRDNESEYGPVYSTPLSRVHSIRYEDGSLDIKNPLLTAKQLSSQTYMERYYHPPVRNNANSDRLTVGISADPSGFALYGPSGSVELTKGKLNSLIHFNFPSLGLLVDDNRKKGFGFGIGLGLNYLWHSRIGIIYIGGMAEYCTWEDDINRKHGGVAAMNIGYTYIWQSGIYLRAGGCLGAEWPGDIKPGLLIRPNLSFGYNF